MREFFVFTQISVIPECSSPRREDGPKTMVQILGGFWFWPQAARQFENMRQFEVERQLRCEPLWCVGAAWFLCTSFLFSTLLPTQGLLEDDIDF